MKIKSNERFVIRVYKAKYGWENYDDDIYRLPEDKVNRNDLLAEKGADNKENLLALWQKMLEKYEGYTYCVKDIENDQVITGGVFDTSDDEFIEEYFE